MSLGSSEPAKWLRDADSHYIGARRLGLEIDTTIVTAYMDPFFTLSHGAFERYLKGLLSAVNPTRYTVRTLKGFDHRLGELLKECRSHVQMEVEELSWAVEVLDAEWNHARYLVSARPAQLLDDAGDFRLMHLDKLVAVVRNAVLGFLSKDEVSDSLLAKLWLSKLPFETFREAFTAGNQFLDEFDGLPQQPAGP